MGPVKIYTDGSVYPNPGFGGWGAVLTSGNHVREISGASTGATTNNQMEITAAIESTKLVVRSRIDEIIIVTDSEYLLGGINNWFPKWKTASEFDLNWYALHTKNWDLWYNLFLLSKDYPIYRAEWVRGHQKESSGNIRADELAGTARKAKWDGVDYKEWCATNGF